MLQVSWQHLTTAGVTLGEESKRGTLTKYDRPGENDFDWNGARNIINVAGPLINVMK